MAWGYCGHMWAQLGDRPHHMGRVQLDYVKIGILVVMWVGKAVRLVGILYICVHVCTHDVEFNYNL